MVPDPPPTSSRQEAPLRASDSERQETVDRLRDAAGAGRLSLEELEQLVSRAYAARTRGELAGLVHDLPDPVHARAVAWTEHARDWWLVREHVAAYVVVNVLLVAVWAATGAGYFWPIWPLLGWGIGLVPHAAARRTFGHGTHAWGIACSSRRSPGRTPHA
jgi:Domain of unknown function (DUF1707)/2TM domain